MDSFSRSVLASCPKEAWSERLITPFVLLFLFILIAVGFCLSPFLTILEKFHDALLGKRA